MLIMVELLLCIGTFCCIIFNTHCSVSSKLCSSVYICRHACLPSLDSSTDIISVDTYCS
jgi:hypothetical protein